MIQRDMLKQIAVKETFVSQFQMRNYRQGNERELLKGILQGTTGISGGGEQMLVLSVQFHGGER